VQRCKENAEYIHTYKNIVNGNVLDIACNDGSQLDYFKNLNWNTYGVDPAENLIPITKSKGHNVICDFWNDAAALKLPKMDVIIAQNVFAHTEYIDNFLKSCKLIMHDNTSLFIQTSQKNMIINNEFDTIYHEHISFFNTKSMNILVSRNGLVLNRVLENQIHGISYIFEIKVQKDLKIYNIDDIIHKEELIGIYNHEIYNTFSLNAQQSVINIKSCLEKYKNDGFKCIGFGAAAKGQTFICYGDIQLDYIIDENPLKIGLYSPKLNIPIVDLTYFKNDFSEKIIIVILAWNFSKEIISKIRDLNKNNTIVIIEKYFPELILFLE
jgi:2-polyprenyl-3-methyl-5-hydroxy-6-metoxy-1,4-benzoquinol methylase